MKRIGRLAFRVSAGRGKSPLCRLAATSPTKGGRQRLFGQVLLPCVLTACLTLTAAASEIPARTDAAAPENVARTDAAAPEFDGYLARIDPDALVSLLSASAPDFPDMAEVYAPAGVYQVDDAAALDALRNCGALLDAEPNYIVTLDDVPGDAASDAATLLDASEAQWFDAPLELDWVRAQGFRGQGVRVGVVDSGIFKDHVEFQGVKILDGANYCVKEGDEARSDISDSYGHGTFVSGLITAAENGVGIVGIAPAVELVPLKCFEGKSGSVANIASAIYDAVDTWHCQVLNLSLGLERDSVMLRQAVEYADKAGVVMVAAAGNLLSGAHNENGDPVNYPAAYSSVIGVGAVDSTLSVSSFSYRNESVEIVAPGRNLRGPSPSNAKGYVTGYGTSYAAPMVTAAAALTLSARPGLTKAQVRDILLATAHDAGERGYDTAYGYGILHAGHLLAAASGNLAHQTEVIRSQLADAADPAPGLFAAAYDADGAFLAARDVSPLTAESEPDETPSLSADADAISAETFQAEGAALWKLFAFDRAAFAPFGASVTLYGPVAAEDGGADEGGDSDGGADDSGPGANNDSGK